MSELFERAKSHIHRSEWEPAIALLSQHLNANFDDEIALWCLASAAIEVGKPGVAAAYLHQALAIRKQKSGTVFTDALMSLGVAYFQTHRVAQAEELFLAALDLEKDPITRSDILANLGK